MVLTNTGISGLILALGSFSTNRPQYMAIGSGSGTTDVTNVNLVNEVSRKLLTSTTIPVTSKVVYTADWNSVQMSGIGISELASFTESGTTIGSCWSRENFDTVSFDGTNELQVQVTFQSY